MLATVPELRADQYKPGWVMTKLLIIIGSCGSTMVAYLTTDPEIQGSNPADAKTKRMNMVLLLHIHGNSITNIIIVHCKKFY